MRNRPVQFAKSNIRRDIILQNTGKDNIGGPTGSLKTSNVSSAGKVIAVDDEFIFLSTVRVLNRTGPFTCDKCGSRSSSRTAFQLHHSTYHRNFSVLCDLCPLSFVKKYLLARHMRKDHLNHSFECYVCLNKFPNKRALKTHMLRHDPKTECKICHKLVTNMYEHKKNHIKLKCSICSKICSRASLSFHMRTHRNRK